MGISTKIVVGDATKCKQCYVCRNVCPSSDIQFVPFIDGYLVNCYEHIKGPYPKNICAACFSVNNKPFCVEACTEHALRLVDVRRERISRNNQAVVQLFKYWGGRKKHE